MADARSKHEGHDELVIVALLDRDLREADRAAAEFQVATCSPCAVLHADLQVLAMATVALPTAPRPRDFTLTASDAARLVHSAAGEPHPSRARLSGDMTHQRSDHASHDQLLIAALADHAASGIERDEAEELIATCHACAVLHQDLLALSLATHALPALSRPRDFTLSAADASRLRPAGWRSWISGFGSSRDALSRPLAMGLTTLGLAGLLVATIPAALSGPASGPGIQAAVGDSTGGARAQQDLLIGSPPAEDSSVPAAAAAAPSEPVAELAQPGAAVTPGGEFDSGNTYTGSGEAATSDSSGFDTSTKALESEPPRSVMIILAGLLLVVGLGIFALRWTARRTAGG